MKKKRKIIISIILLVLFILLLPGYISFRVKKIENSYAEEFENKLTLTVRQNNSFNINDLTPFKWNKLYIIPPYTSRTEMQKMVGVKWTTVSTYLGYLLYDITGLGEYPLDDDLFYKLVFVKNKKVIADITLDRNTIDFTQVKDNITPEDSLFTIDKSKQNPTVKKQIPLQ